MPNAKISELSAAAALTGTELIELVQSGDNVRGTTQAVANLASSLIPANPLSLDSQFTAFRFDQSTGNFSFLGVGTSMGTTGTESIPVRDANSLLGSLSRLRVVSAAGQVAARWFLNKYGMVRAVDGIADGGGFSTTLLFGVENAGAAAGQKAFFGLWAGSSQPLQGAEASATPNCLGVGKDSGDTNLYFLHNDDGATATKFDTGLTWASLDGKVLQLKISCGKTGTPVAITFRVIDTDVEVTYSASSNLPLSASGSVTFANAALREAMCFDRAASGDTAVAVHGMFGASHWAQFP